jgi:hypothetical protein
VAGYLPEQDARLLAFYASPDAPKLGAASASPSPPQRAVGLGELVEEIVSGCGALPQLGPKAYAMGKAAAEAAAAAVGRRPGGKAPRMLFTAGGAIVESSGGAPLSVRRGGFSLGLAAAAGAADGGGHPGDRQWPHQVLITLPGGTALAVCGNGTGDKPADGLGQGPVASSPEHAASSALLQGASAAVPPEAQERSAPQQPQLAQPLHQLQPAAGCIQVRTPGGLMVQLDTHGRALLSPHAQRRHAPRPMRGVRVHGAPIADANLAPLMPLGRGEWQALLPDGHLLRSGAAAPGDLYLLMPDGSTSERTEVAPAAVSEAAVSAGTCLKDVPGWLRTLPDGRRAWEADGTVLGALLNSAKAEALATAEAAASAAAAAAEAIAAAAESSEAGSKKAKAQSRAAALNKQSSKGGSSINSRGLADAAAAAAAPLPPSPAEAAAAAAAAEAATARLRGLEAAAAMGQVPLAPMRAVRTTDHDTGALVCTREDGVMAVHYAEGSYLVMVSI